ncbi:threonine/homoserine/homoserine lactone efflux protein [Sporomusaceae bacterium BoRhaA]|uniref:LysE family translocator n=1 Tax=Pelorhabdus rhamnosifermentans TaxID=2772457 RepID=UPI001C060E98|nr:LysE family translocator [Pelorhabdus rhamnosifermentans]MBU2699424.1 threonine/homoserine/homoserine lactone efflux protein [Pelorhabdus rhamnosifermentans]
MEITNIYLFISISFILLISPGPNTIYVVSKGMTEGRKAAFKAVVGATAGDMIQVLAASLGLAVLLQASSLAFFIVKMFGASYLFYVGIRCFLNKQQLFVKSSEEETKGKDLIFTGFFTSVLNPKTTLFFLSFLPQFIDNQSVYAQQQMLLLGAIFVVMGFFVMNVYAVVAEKLRFWIAKNERIQAYLNWITGAIFIGFGLRIAFSERR